MVLRSQRERLGNSSQAVRLSANGLRGTTDVPRLPEDGEDNEEQVKENDKAGEENSHEDEEYREKAIKSRAGEENSHEDEDNEAMIENEFRAGEENSCEDEEQREKVNVSSASEENRGIPAPENSFRIQCSVLCTCIIASPDSLSFPMLEHSQVFRRPNAENDLSQLENSRDSDFCVLCILSYNTTQRRDQRITLWDNEQLQQSIHAHPQINTHFNVTASDSIEEKSHLLNIDGCLKLSFLSGTVNISGAAKYLSDTKKSFKQQRLTLHYHSTTKFEALAMNHLASGNIAHSEVFDHDTATHVVTAVLYGADACFVFDREVSSDEDKSTVEGEVKAAFEKLKGISASGEINGSKNDHQKTAVQKFSCTFYGDFQLPSNPSSFEDALRVFADLPKLLGVNKELAVPLRVWLYPLDKLNSSAAKLQKEIHTSLIKNVESVIESLNITEMKCIDLLKDTPSLAFAGFHNKIMLFKQNCCAYKLTFMKKLGSLLPKIRGDMEKETALFDLLLNHEECPFRGSDLEQWMKEKETESITIKSLLRQLKDSGAKVEDILDEILMDLDVENVVSYTFTSFEWPDVLLSKQKAFLSPSSKGHNDGNPPDPEQTTGFSSDIKMTMRRNLIIFKNLIKSNTCKSTKFIVTSKEMKNLPGSCILLYENGSEKATCFIPPLKPSCSFTEQITSDGVVVKLSPSCDATEELKLQYKMKEEKDWKYQSVLQGQSTVTLTDLRPDTEYEIKCTAVGKLNYIVDSDVIAVTTHHNYKRKV
ncbi:hypothetical protein Q8A67_023972 [Cirrhinus molitorella]|uniref:Fibronectin type-III domain-containing protein n=1 Tax=Cirrhinus molitorella TaxID=172907 RepID=A0AA88TAP4_9TELE|nr:hypothetical protein Q8A67_023972 [Cirrhinus molitorella]